MKPIEGTFAENALRHGVAGLNIDGSRVGLCGDDTSRKPTTRPGYKGSGGWKNTSEKTGSMNDDWQNGRWPANLVLQHADGCVRRGVRRVKSSSGYVADHHKRNVDSPFNRGDGSKPTCYVDADGLETVDAWDCVEGCPVRMLDEQSGVSPSSARPKSVGNIYTDRGQATYNAGIRPHNSLHDDTGTASRFFYTAKASKRERNAGCEGLEAKQRDLSRRPEQVAMNDGEGNPYNRGCKPVVNSHPTLKPLALCKYLATLILPPPRDTPRRILVPFAGSGSEMIGAMLAGWDEVVGIEKEAEYVTIANARLAWWQKQIEKYGTPLDPAEVLACEDLPRSADTVTGQMELF